MLFKVYTQHRVPSTHTEPEMLHVLVLVSVIYAVQFSGEVKIYGVERMSMVVGLIDPKKSEHTEHTQGGKIHVPVSAPTSASDSATAITTSAA